MSTRINKLFLTSHITVSVGWLGAVAVFLILAITGITSKNQQISNAVYLAMEISAWFVILPFCIASLVTGVIQALITKWGLIKHYWIVVKLILTMGSTVLLVLHLQPIAELSKIASGSGTLIAAPKLQMQMIADSGAALLVLIAITAISIYKPWGKTGLVFIGTKSFSSTSNEKRPVNRYQKYILFTVLILTAIFIIKHLAGGGMHNH